MKVLQEINSARKHEGMLLPYKLTGVIRRYLAQCGIEAEEMINAMWIGGNIGSKKPTKDRRKVWEGFEQWVRCKNIISVKDF